MGATPSAIALPATASARAFRAALDALSRPGSVRRIEGPEAPAGLSPAAAALLATLSDPETPVFLALPQPEAAAGWLAFVTGAPLAGSRAEAVLAVGPWEALAPLASWPQGTADYPDRSATLIVEVDALEGGRALALSGPGIAGARGFAPRLPDGAAGTLAANARAYPLGLDFFFAAGDRIAGLPRSTRIGG